MATLLLRLAEDLVDRVACPVLGVGPEMGVGVERLRRARIAKPHLDGLDRLAVRMSNEA